MNQRTPPQAMQGRPPAAPPPPRQNRMPLANLVRGKQRSPKRVLIYGVDKIGKTTFGAGAPKPVIIGPEDGSGLLDVARFPISSWQDTLDAVETLTNEEHDFQTAVIDSLDWLEPLCWRHVCAEAKQESIESFGYGKGYTAALDAWRVLIAALEKLRRVKGMHVVLIGHAVCKTFKNPTGEDFDRYSLKLNEKAAGLWKEWVDAILFAAHEVYAAKDLKNERRVRGVDTGARLIHTVYRAAWDAGNRYSLPETLPLSWEDFEQAADAEQVASPDALLAAIDAAQAQLSETDREKVTAAVARAGADAKKLAFLNNWISARIGAQTEQTNA